MATISATPVRTPFAGSRQIPSFAWVKWFQEIATTLGLCIDQSIQPKTANYTAEPGDTVLMDATGGARTVTLPLASISSGQIRVIKTDVSGNSVTVSRAGADTINGANTQVLAAQYNKTTLVSDGVSRWYIFA